MRRERINSHHFVLALGDKVKPIWQLTALILTLTVFSVQAQQLTSRPDRGFGGNGGYQSSDIDSISLQNGSVNLQVPLASLPPVAGGKLSYTLLAHYNSKLWDAHRKEVRATTSSPGCQPSYSSQEIWTAEGGAGWRIGGQYEIFYRDAHDDYDYLPADSEQCYGHEFYYMQGRFFKPMLRTPDGAEHELRILGYWETYSSLGNRDHLKGYYKQPPGGYPNYPVFSSPVRMYTIDGTYLNVIVYPPSYATSSIIYMKDGTRIENSADGQRIIDSNGNSILNGGRTVNGVYEQFVKDEQTGREIKWSATFYNGKNATKVEYQTVGGGWQNIMVVWDTITVQGKLYSQTSWNPNGGEFGGGDTCAIDVSLPVTNFNVIREIILPTTEQGVAPRKFTFGYNSETMAQATTASPRWVCNSYQTFPDHTRSASFGWGELSDVTTPTGSHIKYKYKNDGIHDFPGFVGHVDDSINEILRDVVTEKKVTHDGTIDIWTYGISTVNGNFVSSSFVTNPDGSFHGEYYHPTDISSSIIGGTVPQNYVNGLGGLTFRTVESGQIMTERKWITLGGATPAIGAPLQGVGINTAVDTEFTTLLDGNGNRLKISAKKFQYDYNGELLQTIEYDWFNPGDVTYTQNNNPQIGMPTDVPANATVLRVVNNAYYNQAPNSSSTYAYHQRSLESGSIVILGAIMQSTVGTINSVISTSQFSYDNLFYGAAPTKGNVTQIRNWDNTNGQWLTSTIGYDPIYGNITSKTDPNDNITQIFYEDSTHAMPTRTVVDPLNGTGQQTTSVTFDFYTGAVLTTTDINGNISSINYWNHLLGAVDPFGRPGTAYSPYVTVDGVNKRQTAKTYYEDNARKTRVETDLFNEGDALLKTRESRDQLGRTVLVEKNENGASSYSIFSETVYKTQNRIVLTSNPRRSTASATDGWTLLESDILGRTIKTAAFSGAAQPAITNIETNPNWTGSVTTSYSANTTTVTDQTGRKRRSVVDALGRLVRLDEPNDQGQLDINGNPAQPTYYAYDVLGNLTLVTQGSQTRSFTYDSISRLKTSSNPESGIVNYNYDNNGNLLTKIDTRNVKTTYSYDGLNRLQSRTYSLSNGSALPAELATPNVSYTYENMAVPFSKGRLTKVTNGFSTTEYAEFDQLGKVKKSRQTTDGTAYPEMTYAYNLAGQLIEQKYPSGRVVKNILESDGDLSEVQSRKNTSHPFSTYASQFNYTAAGAVSSMRLGNGRWESATFNSRLQPTQIALGTTQNGVDLLKINYEYGDLNLGTGQTIAGTNNGNVSKQTITVPTVGANAGFTATQYYAYDPLNRLKIATENIEPANQPVQLGWRQHFTYDRYGNRNFQTGGEAPTTTIGGCPQAVCNPSFNQSNNKFNDNQGYFYDAAGNLTRDAEGKQFTYDAENKQKEVRDANNVIIGQYYYGGDGKRVKKFIFNVQETTIFIYDASGRLVAEYSSAANNNPQLSYLTADHLGSPRIITDASGNVNSRRDFMPFGEEISTVQRTTRTDYAGDKVRQKFTGYERDNESGLDFAQARYFAYNYGRFISVDPIMMTKNRLADPQSINLYVYTRNNPLRFIDPSGEEFKGTDGNAVIIEKEDGKWVIKSNNASKDLQRLVRLINNSGSSTANRQFGRLNAHKTMINFVFGDKDPQGPPPKAAARHEPHGTIDKDGSKGKLTFDSNTKTFNGTADIVKDANGNEVYAEATITIYEGEYRGSLQTKEDAMVATFGHEAEHSLDLNQVQETKNKTYSNEVYHPVNPDGRPKEGSPDWMANQISREIREHRMNTLLRRCPPGIVCHH